MYQDIYPSITSIIRCGARVPRSICPAKRPPWKAFIFFIGDIGGKGQGWVTRGTWIPRRGLRGGTLCAFIGVDSLDPGLIFFSC